MSKRALSPSLDTSSSSSSSSSSTRSQRRRPRLQLLRGLPASLLSAVCSFLSVYQIVSTVRCTCRALHKAVTSECLLQSHLTITSESLPALAASEPGTRALVRRIPSLSIVYQLEREVKRSQLPMSRLQELRSPLDASRFLFSSLSSLYVAFQHDAKPPLPPRRLVAHRCLLSLLQLLTADAQSFPSLRRLHIDDYAESIAGEVELPFSSLARLPALTHLRIELTKAREFSSWSLLSALSPMLSLTSLDLENICGGCSQLLPLLCADSATPLLLQLRSLLLPAYCGGLDVNDDGLGGQHDAFLCRLSSLPAPPALQRFSGAPVCYRAAGLLSVCSLPHLTQLSMTGNVWGRELSAVASLVSAPAPLTSLVLPRILREHDDKRAVAVCSAARLLLSRFTHLRRLSCDADIASGLAALPGSLPGARGCSGSLYSLTVQNVPRSRFSCTPALSFPLLTALAVFQPMKDAELEQLLSACPQLLDLRCRPSQSFDVVLTAARCCPRLLNLKVRMPPDTQHARDAAVAAPLPVVASPFLPQLLTLSLDSGRHASLSGLKALQHFTSPPHAQLRRVHLTCHNSSAEHVLRLACLPLLSHLYVRIWSGADGQRAEVEEASMRTRQQLLSRAAAAGADLYRLWSEPARREDCEGHLERPHLGPHQQQEMRQRMLSEGETDCWAANMLARVEGVEQDTVRAVFVAELRSVLAAASDGTGREDDEKDDAAASPCRQ